MAKIAAAAGMLGLIVSAAARRRPPMYGRPSRNSRNRRLLSTSTISRPPCYYGLATPMFVGKTLYGVLNDDNNADIGCIFSLTPNGSAYTYKEVYPFKEQFTGDANNSHGVPILIGHDLYDTSFFGGAHSEGTVFRYSLDTPQGSSTARVQRFCGWHQSADGRGRERFGRSFRRGQRRQHQMRRSRLRSRLRA